MKFLLSLCFVAMLFAAGCSAPQQPAPIATPAQGSPALWKVSLGTKAGGSAYLFGTVHMLPKGTQWQGPIIDEAVRESSVLVTEVTGLNDETAVAKTFGHMAISPNQPPLAQRVPSELRAGLEQAMAQLSMPAATLNTLETWAAALTIGANSSSDMGLNKSLGADNVLTMQFTAAGKPVTGLETLAQQFGFMDSLSETEQRFMLSQIVKEQMQGKAEVRRDMQLLLTSWLAGDSDALLAGANSSIVASPVIREVLLEGRNRRWSNQIAAMIEKGERPFVAVGAAHLAGPGGVPELLKGMGYKVDRVQ
jgi:uncharacterized protein